MTTSIFDTEYATAHTDGWRLRKKEDEGVTVFTAVFLTNGTESREIEPVEVCRLRSADRDTVLRTEFLLVAMVRYMNMGGSATELERSARAVGSSLGEVSLDQLELVAVSRSRPPALVWHDRARGEYLRVVEGDFSELLDPDEVTDFVDTHYSVTR